MSGVISIARAMTLAVALVAVSLEAHAADAVAGKALFRQRCTLCHTAEAGDGGGSQGPSLQRVFGKRAGSNPAFSYSVALRDSKLTWDVQTLERFLKSPTTVVPSSRMVVPVPRKEDRENLIAYFQSVATTSAARLAVGGSSAAASRQEPGLQSNK